jgi:LPS-assembly lipoprotein
LVGFAPRSPLAQELRLKLLRQVSVLDTPDTAEVVLQALDDAREKSIVASTAAAQVREVQLRVKFNFRARTPGGRELIPRAELLVSRDLSYSETAALAKEHEEAELYAEMQTDVVGQVLRRLASVSA